LPRLVFLEFLGRDKGTGEIRGRESFSSPLFGLRIVTVEKTTADPFVPAVSFVPGPF
jgi:hypothetical protein